MILHSGLMMAPFCALLVSILLLGCDLGYRSKNRMQLRGTGPKLVSVLRRVKLE